MSFENTKKGVFTPPSGDPCYLEPRENAGAFALTSTSCTGKPPLPSVFDYTLDKLLTSGEKLSRVNTRFKQPDAIDVLREADAVLTAESAESDDETQTN